MLEQAQAIPAARQARPTQEALDGGRGHVNPELAGQLGGDTATAPGRPGQRNAQDQPLDVGRDLPRPAQPGVAVPRMQAIGPVALEPLPPPIEHGARDAGLSAGQRDAVQLLGAPHDAQPHREYALVEGHRFLLPQSFPWWGTDSGKDRTDGLLVVPSLSTLLRVGTV